MHTDEKEVKGEEGGGEGKLGASIYLSVPWLQTHYDQLPHSAAIMSFLPDKLYPQTRSQINPFLLVVGVPATTKAPDTSIFCMLLVFWGCVTTDPIIVFIAAEEIDAWRC